MSTTTHTHVKADGTVITHTHQEEESADKKDLPAAAGAQHIHSSDDSCYDKEFQTQHGHYHDPDKKKKQLNRISKATGHLLHVKMMIENDEDCADVLIQLSAVEAALHSLGKEIITEHLSHCIIHAIEDGDTRSVESFQEAIKKFL